MGDVNLDGVEDIVVGEPTGTNVAVAGVITNSLARVFSGASFGLAGPPVVIATQVCSAATPCAIGTAAAGLGDVDGDGFADVALGAPDPTCFSGACGTTGARAYYLPGQKATLAAGGIASMGQQLLGPCRGYATVMRRIADYNADGIADVLIGAPFPSMSPCATQGSAYILSGTNLAFSFDVAVPTTATQLFGTGIAVLSPAVAGGVPMFAVADPGAGAIHVY